MVQEQLRTNEEIWARRKEGMRDIERKDLKFRLELAEVLHDSAMKKKVEAYFERAIEEIDSWGPKISCSKNKEVKNGC